MASFYIPLAHYIDIVVDFLLLHFRPYFRAFSEWMEQAIQWVEAGLLFIPAPLLILLICAVAWRLVGIRLALLCAAGLGLIYGTNLWAETMTTLTLVLIGTSISLALGIPMGIIASGNDWLEKFIRPIMDIMQTLPSFVYLVPAVMFFSLGTVPGVIATVIFSLPPPIRLTNLGIRQVPTDMVEVARAFGATRWQTMYKIQLPLALPSIMAGVNQCIMMALSMTVIAAMIGAGGLGGNVLSALQRVKIGLSFESGIAIVILAIILDRFTQTLGRKSDQT